MPIKTSRTDGCGRIRIDRDKCTGCGVCVSLCPDESLVLANGKPIESPKPLFGCFACGQCVMACPEDAIMVEGRTLSSGDFFYSPFPEARAKFEALQSLMCSRRSVRHFLDRDVSQDILHKILDAASTAPMGIPPSDVRVLVLKGKDRVKGFSLGLLEQMRGKRFFISPLFLALMRPFMSKEDGEMYSGFIRPLVESLLKKADDGEDWLLYEAPAAILFYGAGYSDPADAVIAATYAMLAAESLGVGSCLIGSVVPFLRFAQRPFKERFGLDPRIKDGIMIVLGYPRFNFKKTVRRTFADVKVL